MGSTSRSPKNEALLKGLVSRLGYGRLDGRHRPSDSAVHMPQVWRNDGPQVRAVRWLYRLIYGHRPEDWESCLSVVGLPDGEGEIERRGIQTFAGSVPDDGRSARAGVDRTQEPRGR